MARRRANREGTIRQRPDGRWEAIISTGRDPVSGKLQRVSFYGKTQKEVIDKATTARHQIARGTYVDPSRLSVGEWLPVWLETYKAPRVRPLTLESYTHIVTRHLRPTFGHIPLQDLRPEHIERYLTAKRDAGLDPATIRLHTVILSNALGQAEKVGRVARNVCRLVDAPPRRRKDRQTLSMAQGRDQLLPTVARDRFYALYVTLFMTGVRRGELLGLRWQDVDLARGTLAVRQIVTRFRQSTKTYQTALQMGVPKTEQLRRTIALTKECFRPSVPTVPGRLRRSSKRDSSIRTTGWCFVRKMAVSLTPAHCSSTLPGR